MKQKHNNKLISGTNISIKEFKELAFEKFKEFKEQFVAKNEELKVLLKQVDGIKGVLEENNVVVEEEQRKVAAKVAKERVKEVDAKVKSGGKLTTEDLLVFQRNMK